jgi:hypothetical protein
MEQNSVDDLHTGALWTVTWITKLRNFMKEKGVTKKPAKDAKLFQKLLSDSGIFFGYIQRDLP